MAAKGNKRRISAYIPPILFCGLLIALALLTQGKTEQPVKAVLQESQPLTLTEQAIENYLYSAGLTLRDRSLLDADGREAATLAVDKDESGAIGAMTLTFPLPTYYETGDGDILAGLKANHDAGAQRGEEAFLALFDAIGATDGRAANRRDSAVQKLRTTMDTGKASQQAANSWRFSFSLEPGLFEGTVTVRFEPVK